MSLKQLSVRLEIGFWQLVIQLLSESRFIQPMFTRIVALGTCYSRFFQSLDRERLLPWASIGFASGFLTGLITVLL